MKRHSLPRVDGRRGAPMGRPNDIMEPNAAIKFNLCAMRMVDVCYDSGGAYWGAGSVEHGYMWHAFGEGPLWVNQMFVRAKDREDAKSKVLAAFKNATFHR